MKLIINIQTVPDVLKATMKGTVKYENRIIDIPNKLIPDDIIEIIDNSSDDKFICNIGLVNI
jgi:hypothetical protein